MTTFDHDGYPGVQAELLRAGTSEDGQTERLQVWIRNSSSRAMCVAVPNEAPALHEPDSYRMHAEIPGRAVRVSVRPADKFAGDCSQFKPFERPALAAN